MTSNSSRLRPEPTATHVSGLLGDVHRDLRLVADALVESLQEGTAAGQHDAAVHDVGGELGWRLVELDFIASMISETARRARGGSPRKR